MAYSALSLNLCPSRLLRCSYSRPALCALIFRRGLAVAFVVTVDPNGCPRPAGALTWPFNRARAFSVGETTHPDT